MRRTLLTCLAVASAVLTLPAVASAADAIYGITDGNRLIRFNSDAPGSTVSNVPIGGLGAGEAVLSIDVRPADDHLYAITTANRALQVNPVTGATRPAFGPFSPALSGTSYGFDFNPVADNLRIVSDAEQNLRVTNDNKSSAEAPLNYKAGDAGFGTNPSVGAAAYNNNVPTAKDSILYDIDSARDVLVRQDPMNAGTLTTVGPLGVQIDEPVGFDIAPNSNVAYAAFKVTGQPNFGLYTIDLNTGKATPVSERSTIAVPLDAGALRGIAVAGPVANDTTAPSLSVAFSSTILEQNTDVLKPSVSCDETCTITVNARVDGHQAGKGAGLIQGAGRVTVEVRLNSSARRRIARPGTELISLDITATDAAGNRRSQNNRISRTQTLSARRG
jgi:hypothetical protein